MRLEKEVKEKKKATPVLQSQPKTTGLNSAASPSTDNVNFAVSSNILYVCKSANACRSKGHKVESATGMLLNHFNRVIQINTNYCPDCKKFFIGYDEYKRYRQLYNGLMGNIKITSGSFAFNANTLADESILHVCGYSTNQQDDLTATERQNILKYLMDSGISSKSEIIDYLNYFIGRNGKKAGNHVALSRWQEDLSWVEQYRIDRQRRFEIAQIIKNR